MIFLKCSLNLFLCALALCVFSCSKIPKLERENFPLSKDIDVSDCKVGKYGGFFVLAGSTPPMTFNELVNTEAETGLMLGLMYSSLVTYDPISLQYIPALAKSWEVSEDAKTYVFTLREGIKFSDGVEITSADVVFTFDCVFAPKIDANGNPILDEKTGKALLRYPSRYAGQYTIGGEYVKYRALDKYRIEFTTKKVYAPFINDIGGMSIFPKHKLEKAFNDGTLQQAWSTNTAITSPEEIVSSGPFKLHSYRASERLVLTANPHYWRADSAGNRLPYLDYLIFKFVADANTATILFATGQCDAAGMDASDYSWVRHKADTYGFKIYERGPSANISFIWFNQNPNAKAKSGLPDYKLKWFTDKNFRQAIMCAIDRDGIVKGVWFGRAKKLDSIISSANKKWYNADVKTYDYSPKNALKKLEQSGFKLNEKGELFDSQKNKVEFSLLVADSSKNSMATATIIAENLKKIGITMNIVSMDFMTIVSRIDDTFNYEAAMMGFTGGGDPSGGKAIYKSDGFLHVWNPRQKTPATTWEAEVDCIIDEQESTLDESKRIALIGKMQELYAEELPLIFLTTPLSYTGIKKKWKNVKIPPLGSVLWNIEELFEGEDD